MPRSILIAGLALSSLACGPSELSFGFPPQMLDEGAVSYVVLIEDLLSDTVQIAEGRPVEGGSVRLTLDATANQRLRLLAYDQALDQVGLVAGALPRGPDQGGTPLPDPQSAWQSDLWDDAPTWRRTEGLQTSALPFRLPAASIDPCAAFMDVAQPWQIESLPLTNLLAATVVAEDRLLLGGSRYFDPIQGLLGFADFLQGYEPLPYPFVSPSIQSLERLGDRVFGVTRSELFELDPQSGAVVRTSTAFPESAWILRVGRDGTAAVFDPFVPAARWADLDTLSTRPLDSPEDFSTMLVLSSTLAFGSRDNRIYAFDGQRWRLEETLVPGTISEFFARGDQVGLIFNTQTLYLRNAEGDWSEMPRIVAGLASASFARFMAHGRILVAGQGGSTYGWTGEQWCDILTGIQRATRGIAVSEDGETAFIHAFAENSSQRAPIIRIQPRASP